MHSSSPAFLLPTPLPSFQLKHCLRRSYSVRTQTPPRQRSPRPTATAAAASSQPPHQSTPKWTTRPNIDLLVPQSPSLILIFTGGLAASLSPRTTYSAFLTRLSETTNAAILAHRTPPSNDHIALARTITDDLRPHLSVLRRRHPDLLTFAIGHSLGAKLTLLASTDHTCRHSIEPIFANILISFCNRSASDAVPWANDGKARAADTLSKVSDFLRNVDVSLFEDSRAGDVRENITNAIDAVETSLRREFKPSPDETLALIGARYHIPRNLVISFENDDLDDAPQLVRVLKSRFGDSGVIARRLAGTHVTPMTPELNNGFYGTGSAQFDSWVKDAGNGVGKELDGLVAVVTAFLKLQMQIVEKS